MKYKPKDIIELGDIVDKLDRVKIGWDIGHIGRLIEALIYLEGMKKSNESDY